MLNTYYYISIKMPSPRYSLPKRILSSIFLVLFFLPLHSANPDADIQYLSPQEALQQLKNDKQKLQPLNQAEREKNGETFLYWEGNLYEFLPPNDINFKPMSKKETLDKLMKKNTFFNEFIKQTNMEEYLSYIHKLAHNNYLSDQQKLDRKYYLITPLKTSRKKTQAEKDSYFTLALNAYTSPHSYAIDYSFLRILMAFCLHSKIQNQIEQNTDGLSQDNAKAFSNTLKLAHKGDIDLSLIELILNYLGSNINKIEFFPEHYESFNQWENRDFNITDYIQYINLLAKYDFMFNDKHQTAILQFIKKKNPYLVDTISDIFDNMGNNTKPAK